MKRNRGRLTNSAFALLFAGTMFVSCEDELLTGMPSWLGSSIYEELKARGGYETTLKLIDDPVFAQDGLPTILGQTGSRTLFVADDEAYKRFFESNNAWGVHSYEELSEAQKRLLMNTSMLQNAYLMELLSNTSAESGDMTESTGQALRHSTYVSLFDSIQVLKPADMPSNSYWDQYRNKNMLIMRDATLPTISHYLPAFMANYSITDEDVNFLTNGAHADNSSSYVNGIKVKEQDITCQNGYIQVLEDVMMPLTSMAEMIGNNPDYSLMKSFLDRFAFPEANLSATNTYNNLYNGGAAVDTVYTWRYLNNGFNSLRSEGGTYRAVNQVNNVIADSWANLLPYDPGWNFYENGASGSSQTSAYTDMAVFFVPTNDAFAEYIKDGAGKTLMDNYGSWDNVPNHIISKLLQNLMKTSLVGTVPSKFHTVLNTAQQSFFTDESDKDAVVSCHLANNGVIYETNKVFSAPEYVAVSFPVSLDDNMRVIRQAITDLQFDTYLNSMDSKYTFLPPTDAALANYIDPVDIHKSSTRRTISEFYYDEASATIRCKRYYMNADGSKGREVAFSSTTITETNYIQNRMQDILNNSIIIGNIEDSLRMGYNVFVTKNGSPVVFAEGINQFNESGITLTDPYRIETADAYNTLRNTNGRYDMEVSSGNGVTYILDKAPVMPASKSVLQVLEELKDGDSRYTEFYDMLNNSGLATQFYDDGKTISNGKTISVMNNYRYTVYAPTTESIEELYKAGVLYDFRDLTEENIRAEFADEWADVKGETDDETEDLLMVKADSVIQERQGTIDDFLRYHIQNTAVYLGSDIQEISYETTLMNQSYGRFYSLGVKQDGKTFKVESRGYDGQLIPGVDARKVISDENHYAREYHFRVNKDGTTNITDINNAQVIYNSSYAVIHLIDGPLLYDNSLLPGSAVNQNFRNKTKR